MIATAIIILGAGCAIGGLALTFHGIFVLDQPPKARDPARKAFYDEVYSGQVEAATSSASENARG